MSLVAYTYAKALKESFKKEEKEKFFSFLKELRELNKVLDLLEIKAFFISPVISVQEKKELLEKVFPLFMPNRSEMDRPQASIPLGKKLTETTEGKPDQHTSRELLCSFLFLLLDKKRWGELNVILS
ncbi:MAG: hypothetical protein F4X95_02110, partial [Oligoflexia bacterium]|nr:hypothetical protein [Oligoflexia bacterium]